MDSAALKVRRQIRNRRWLSRPRSRPSSRRCEASRRCMPRLRPTLPMALNRSRNSGRAVSSSPNSSTTMSSEGNGSSRGSVAHLRRVGAQVGLVAGQVQEPLAPGQLALEGGQGPVDHRQVGLQIGDEPRDLRERGQVGEGGAALEVDQHEGELAGRVGGGQAGDNRAQQLALARPCGPNHQPVRPDAVLGRLLEIEHDRIPTHGDPDRHPEQLGSGTRSHPVTRSVRSGRGGRGGGRDLRAVLPRVGVRAGGGPCAGRGSRRREGPRCRSGCR